MEIRDPIHGFIEFNDLERTVFDSPAFQRLRRVRQLALANYVYPCANHSRFEHSLGVMHVAGVLAKQLELSPEQTKLVRLAGLVHDLGHGPFGHVSEDAFKALGHNPGRDHKAHKFHEYITLRIIKSPSFLGRILGNHAEQIAHLLHPESDPSLEKEIVSGAIDADKIDYLLRDSYFCGVKYGLFDIDKLVRSLDVQTSATKKYLMVQYEGLQALEQYIVAKYYISTQVYRHKVRLITDAMLVRAITLAYDSNAYINGLYNFTDATDEYLNNYLDSNDDKLLQEGMRHDSEGRDIFERLRDRKLFKRVFHESADSLKGMAGIEIKKFAFNRDKLNKFETEIAKLFGIKPIHCILNIYKMKFEVGEASEYGSIYVIWHDGEPKALQDISPIVKEVETKLSDVKIDVYVPLDGTTAERETLSQKNHSHIFEILKSFHEK